MLTKSPEGVIGGTPLGSAVDELPTVPFESVLLLLADEFEEFVEDDTLGLGATVLLGLVELEEGMIKVPLVGFLSLISFQPPKPARMTTAIIRIIIWVLDDLRAFFGGAKLL